MIAREHEAAGAKERNPAGRFDRLSGFVDHHEIESSLAKHLAIKACQRRTYDGR